MPAKVRSEEEIVIEEKHIRLDIKEAKGYFAMAQRRKEKRHITGNITEINGGQQRKKIVQTNICDGSVEKEIAIMALPLHWC